MERIKSYEDEKYEIIDVIEDAIGLWTEGDHAHEFKPIDEAKIPRDAGIYDAGLGGLVCNGGNENICRVCADVKANAREAEKLAIKALERDDLERAVECIDRAHTLEYDWGDAPAYESARKAVFEFVRKYMKH